jgi:hypothetical protein
VTAPRIWPKLNPVPEIDDPPAVVEVCGHGRWTLLSLDGRQLYSSDSKDARFELHVAQTLTQLRELGEVREVLS